jgi:demethylmenaquinone methyltransferase/2-methoxy-6-polyprenyl-1,4-benzoquinol methylase
MTKTTDFGFQKVAEKDKARKVAGVFDSVAGRYDLMNDLMSAGLHRLWKRFTVEQSLLRPGERVLDVASGTADLARLFARRVSNSGTVIVTDINAAMLKIGRDRLLDEGVVAPALQCDAEKLPFPGDFFDCVSIAFGLRNMTHKDIALAEMLRVLKPGGRLLVLEFSKVWKPLQALYDTYSFQVLPKLGKLITGDPDSYRYLAESIRMHPDQEQLRQMMERAGFEKVEYFNLAGGVVALHKAYKL